MAVKLSDLAFAVDFSTSGASFDSCAYLNRHSGNIIYTGDFIDDAELPDDLDENSDYVEIPSKQNLDLGDRLVFRFSAEYLPDHVDTVQAIFSRRGAYGRFKDLLEQVGKLEDWYRFEENAASEAVLEWCRANEIRVKVDT